jgi:hypothetical protein
MEWRVAMPFGMSNASATLKRVIRGIMRYIYTHVRKYLLNDVFVYNRTLEEHFEHLRLVQQRCMEEGLELRLKICFFGLEKMEYLLGL